MRAGTGLLPSGAAEFFKRRARRILPPYYAALGVVLLLIALVPPLRDVTHPDALWSEALPAYTPGTILSHLLLVHNFDPRWHSKIDYPMWSVATEWQIYFLFPFLLLPVWRRFGSGGAVGAAFAISLVPLALFFDRLSGVSPHFLGLFALGMAAADLNFSARPRLTAWRERLPWGGLAGTFLVLLLLVSLGVHARWPLLVALKDILVGTATACLLISCTRFLTRHHEAATDQAAGTRRHAPPVLRLLESRPAVALGVFSYSLYLFHAPVLAVCQSAVRSWGLPSNVQLALMLCVGVPLAVLCSYLFHLAFERPFLSRTLAQAAKEVAASKTQ